MKEHFYGLLTVFQLFFNYKYSKNLVLVAQNFEFVAVNMDLK